MKDKKTKRKTNSPASRANTSKKAAVNRKATSRSKAKTAQRAQAKAGAAKVAAAGTASATVNELGSPKEKTPVIIQKLSYKGTFNTHDIMHAPVEKTIKMLEKIIAGERLFTM